MRPTMNVVHVCSAPNGHQRSTDCWCEPVQINWYRNKHGADVLVVMHDDVTLQHRIVIVSERERDRTKPADRAAGIDDAWITRVLSDLDPPKLLPPHDPNARSL